MDFILNLTINFFISWLSPKIGDWGWNMLLKFTQKWRDRISELPEDWEDYSGNL